MVIERTYTITVAALAFTKNGLPNDDCMLTVVRDALEKRFSDLTTRVTASSKDACYGKEEQ